MMRLTRLFHLSASLLAAVACAGRTTQDASSNGGASTCSPGAERCSCNGYNACNQGLECHSDLCVAMGTGGSASNGGTPGASGAEVVGGTSPAATGGTVGLGGFVATGGLPSAGGAPVFTGGRTSLATGGSSSQPLLPKACPGLPMSTGAAGAGATDPDAGPQCAGIGVEPEPSPLDMFIMVDRTQSMTNMIQNTAIQRWDVIQQGVQQFVNDPNVQTRAPRIGIAFFGATGNPNDPTECDPVTYTKPKIEIEPIAISGPKILQAVIDERAFLGGLTPWMPSLEGALVHAQDWQTANPTRKTVVVLVTDGYPTECDTDVSHIQEMVGEFYAGVKSTYNGRGTPGIRTYIIGIAVDKFNLDAVAQAGGTNTATIVDSTGAVDQFVTAMINITNSNTSCDLALPSPPPGQILDPNQVQVVYRPFQGATQELPKASSVAGCSSANGGWYFDDIVNPTKILLCPCSCANVGSGVIELRFGCHTRIAIN